MLREIRVRYIMVCVAPVSFFTVLLIWCIFYKKISLKINTLSSQIIYKTILN